MSAGPTDPNTPLAPAPATLQAPDGRYAGAIADCATAAWDGDGGLFSRRRLQRKGWLYFGLFSPRWLIGCAVVDAGLVATAFLYVADRQSGRLIEHQALAPLGFPARFAPDWRQPWRLARGRRCWQIEPRAPGWRVCFDGPGLALDLQCGDHGRGLSAIARAPGRPFHHSYKLAALDADVVLSLEGRRERFAAAACVDFTLGYPPRQTQWNWASLDGRTDDGERFALNLVAHFLNGLENAFWLGDRLQPLPQALFDYDPAQPLRPWRIRTVDGAVDLVFTPEGRRQENRQAGLLSSRFQQPYGAFEGRLRTSAGERRVRGLGVVEAHQARW